MEDKRRPTAQGYEPADASARGLGLFVLFFLIAGVLLQVLVWVLLGYYNNQPRPADQPTSAVQPLGDFPPPNLQPSPQHNTLPPEDLAALRHREDQTLRQMGLEAVP